jgi:eukaryotic-like serine/threonine-protein kinase
MTLSPGMRVGSYEVASQLGAGGMGEVYRATDTTLKRQVALKVLPDALVADAERLARFQREAEVLAALNHPNIAVLYGVEKSDGVIALVMELVEGPTLADRIIEGPLPVDEALAIARKNASSSRSTTTQSIMTSRRMERSSCSSVASRRCPARRRGRVHVVLNWQQELKRLVP